MPAGSFSEWSPYTSYVQGGMVDGRYANAAFMMIAAGPPRLANVGGAAAFAALTSFSNAGSQGPTGPATNGANQIVYPMGLLQNFSLSHTRQFMRVFELGSERSYHIAGRTVGQLGLGRVYYHGASMLRTLYAYYQDLVPPTLVLPMFSNTGAASVANPHDVVIPPGYDNIFLNLASDLFAQPIGLLFYMRDIDLKTLGATYFEACYVPNHSLGTDAQGVMYQEQAAIQFERAVPVAVSALSLITGNATGASGANATFPGIPGS